MNIRKKFLLVTLLLAAGVYSSVRAARAEDLRNVNVLSVIVSSVAKPSAYWIFNKINKAQTKEYAVPFIGAVRFDRNEAIVESCASVLRLLGVYLGSRCFFTTTNPQSSIFFSLKEALKRGTFEGCEKKDLFHIPIIGARIILEQVITAKHFDEWVAKRLIDENLHPRKYRIVQNLAKWAITIGVVVGSGWISHAIYPIEEDMFIPVIPGLPCTALVKR